MTLSERYPVLTVLLSFVVIDFMVYLTVPIRPGFIVFWTITGIIGWAIGNDKGHPLAGALLGGTLSLIGLVIIACYPAAPKPADTRSLSDDAGVDL